MKYLYLLLIPFVLAANKDQLIFNKLYNNNFDEYNYCDANNIDPEEYSEIKGFVLHSVQIITRHGDRTPLTIIPNNENAVWDCNVPREFVSLNSLNSTHTYTDFINSASDPDYSNPYVGKYLWKGTCFPGQLTEKGSTQHKNIGSVLRKIYIEKLKFLNESDISELYVRSTNVPRTQLSVRSLLSTLLPNNTNSIPIHTVPEEIETIHINKKSCKNINKLFSKIIEESDWKDYIKKNIHLKNKLDDYIGMSLNDAKFGFTKYVDSFLARKCHNLPYPCKYDNCYDPTLKKSIQEKANFEYSYFFKNSKRSSKLIKLGIGFFLREIINNMGNTLGDFNSNDNNTSRKPIPKFYIYSGHDTTIAPLLGALGFLDMEWPPYASNISIELWRDETASKNSTDFNNYSVRIFYNGKILNTDWCDFSNCTLSSLFLRLKEYFPSVDECFD